MSLSIQPVASNLWNAGRGKYTVFAYAEIEREWTYERGTRRATRVHVAPMGSPLIPSRLRMSDFLALEAGWDSYGAKAVSPGSVRGTARILDLIEKRAMSFVPAVPAPFAVSPVPDGGIQLEWRRADGWALEIEVGPNGEISYLIDRRNWTPRFQEGEGLSVFEAAAIIEAFLKDSLF